MGCCEGNHIISEGTENEIENSIRSAIIVLEINNLTVNIFEEKFKNIIGIAINEITDVKWYSPEKYILMINSLMINAKTDELKTKQQNALIVKVNLNDEKKAKKFPYHFFLQIFSLLRDNFDEKIKFLEKGIKTYLNPFTVKSMKKLIFQYLELNLLVITNDYIDHFKLKSKQEAIYLLTKIYTEANLKDYASGFLKSIDRYFLRVRPFKKEIKELENEIVKSEEMKDYFMENKILLDILEVRKCFYTKYSSNFPVMLNDTTEIGNQSIDLK